MTQADVKTPGDAVAWLVGRTLETVAIHAQRPKPVQSQWWRQMAIAQYGLHWILRFKLDTSGLPDEVLFDYNAQEYGHEQRERAGLPAIKLRDVNEPDRSRVSSAGDALNYLIDCVMATVDDYTMMSRPPKKAFAREVEIAQTAIDWARAFDVPLTGRAKTAIAQYGGSVQAYVEEKRA